MTSVPMRRRLLRHTVLTIISPLLIFYPNLLLIILAPMFKQTTLHAQPCLCNAPGFRPRANLRCRSLVYYLFESLLLHLKLLYSLLVLMLFEILYFLLAVVLFKFPVLHFMLLYFILAVVLFKLLVFFSHPLRVLPSLRLSPGQYKLVTTLLLKTIILSPLRSFAAPPA